MSVLEIALMIGFGVPLLVLCSAFVVMAGLMQMEDEQAAARRADY